MFAGGSKKRDFDFGANSGVPCAFPLLRRSVRRMTAILMYRHCINYGEVMGNDRRHAR